MIIFCFRNLFLDGLLSAGSAESVEAAAELLKSEQIPKEHAIRWYLDLNFVKHTSKSSLTSVLVRHFIIKNSVYNYYCIGRPIISWLVNNKNWWKNIYLFCTTTNLFSFPLPGLEEIFHLWDSLHFTSKFKLLCYVEFKWVWIWRCSYQNWLCERKQNIDSTTKEVNVFNINC